MLSDPELTPRVVRQRGGGKKQSPLHGRKRPLQLVATDEEAI